MQTVSAVPGARGEVGTRPRVLCPVLVQILLPPLSGYTVLFFSFCFYKDKVQNLFLRSSYALPTVQAGLELEVAEVPQVAGVCFLVSESSFELTGGRSCGEEASPCLLLGP